MINESLTLDYYIKTARNTKRLSNEVELEYAKKAKSKNKKISEKYKNLLFEANYGMVISVASRYAEHRQTMEDLVQQGATALDKALELFDPKKKTRFSTYAQWWVRAFIAKHFSNNVRSFKVPEAVCLRLHHLNKSIEKLSKILGRTPTNEELAEETGHAEKYLLFLRKYLMPHFTLDAQVMGKSGRPFSTVGDSLTMNDRDDASESLIRVDGINKMKDAVSKLEPNERFVIENRYGLNDCDEQTLAEVGKRMNLTAERIRQIQIDAEKRLKKMVNK
jgi:RNA polymerase sigma factor (sigma-70 family)